MFCISSEKENNKNIINSQKIKNFNICWLYSTFSLIRTWQDRTWFGLVKSSSNLIAEKKYGHKSIVQLFWNFQEKCTFYNHYFWKFWLEKIQIHFHNTGHFQLSVELRGTGTADVEFHR